MSDDIANSLYGDSGGGVVVSQPLHDREQRGGSKDPATVLYGGTTGEGNSIAESSQESKKSSSDEKSLEEVFFGESVGKENGTYGSRMKAGLDKIKENLLMDPEEIVAHREGVSQTFNELDTHPEKAERIYDALSNALVSFPSDEQVQKWEKESKEYLFDKYGDETNARLNAVKKYLDKNPDLKKVLDLSGLGPHPLIVEELTDSVWRLKAMKGL